MIKGIARLWGMKNCIKQLFHRNKRERETKPKSGEWKWEIKRERERKSLWCQTTRMQTFNNVRTSSFYQVQGGSLAVYERIIIGRCGNIRPNFFHPSRPLIFQRD